MNGGLIVDGSYKQLSAGSDESLCQFCKFWRGELSVLFYMYVQSNALNSVWFIYEFKHLFCANQFVVVVVLLVKSLSRLCVLLWVYVVQFCTSALQFDLIALLQGLQLPDVVRTADGFPPRNHNYLSLPYNSIRWFAVVSCTIYV